MNISVLICTTESKSTKVGITGPDNICDPVLNFLIMRLVNDKYAFTLFFNEELEDE